MQTNMNHIYIGVVFVFQVVLQELYEIYVLLTVRTIIN